MNTRTKNHRRELRRKLCRERARLVALVLFFAWTLPAISDVEIRFVPYNDQDADIVKVVADLASPYLLYVYTLTESQRESYLSPYDCWARNIQLDGKPLFEIYYKGSYIDRLPVARPKDLKPGPHTINPGKHVFTINKDGSVQTEDPELVVSTIEVKDDASGESITRHVVRLLAYPVLVQAKDSNPAAPPPAELIEEIPLPNIVLRDASQQAAGGEAVELQPNPTRMLRVRCWLPANTVGAGYTLFPLNHTFHVTPDGVLPGAGDGTALEGWKYNNFTVEIPMTRIHAQGPAGGQLKIVGMQFLKFSELTRDGLVNLYRREAPYEFRVSDVGPSIMIDGDLSRLPNKVLRVDWSGPEQLHQRAMLIESESRHLVPGATFKARIRAVDTRAAIDAGSSATNAFKATGAAQRALSSAQAALTSAKQKLTQAEKKVDAANAPVTAASKKRDDLKTRIATTQKAVKDADAVKARATAAATELAKAEAALKVARTAVQVAQQVLTLAQGHAKASDNMLKRATEEMKIAREREAVEQNQLAKAEEQLAKANQKKDQAAFDAATLARQAAKDLLAKTGGDIRRALLATDAATACAAKEQAAIKAAQQKLDTAKAAEEKALNAAKASDNRHVLAKTESDKIDVAKLKQGLQAAQAELQAAEQAIVKARTDAAAAVKKAGAETQKFRPGVQTAEANVKQKEKALAGAEKAYEKSMGRARKAESDNTLAEVKLYARIQSHQTGAWSEMQLQQEVDGHMQVTVPGDLQPGVYKLRLGIQPTDLSLSSMFADHWVTVAGDSTVGVGLFTRRGRTAFRRGEEFWIAAAVVAAGEPVPAGTEISVDLTGPGGDTVPLLRDKLAEAIESRETFMVWLRPETTFGLAPGEYKAIPKAGDMVGPALRITIVDPEPKTHFLNLLLGKYNQMGFRYSAVIGSGNAIGGRERNLGAFPMRSKLNADEMVRGIVDSGYNAFKGMCYGMARVRFPDSDTIAQLVRERPQLGPAEAFAGASGRDRFLNACVRNGVDFYENLFTQHDTMMPRGEKFLQACERYSTLEAASMRHSPAFKGVCLYDEFAQSLDHDTAGIVMAHFHKADEANYRAKHGRTSSQASRALDKFTGRPPAQRDVKDVEIYRTWPAHLAQQWGDFSTRMSDAVKRSMPDARNFTLARIGVLPGDNLAGVSDWEKVFENLELASAVGYKDMGGWGDFPVSGPIMADVLRHREGLTVAPMIYGLGTGHYSDSNLRHAFFTLSQNVDGISYMAFESSPSDTKAGDNYDGVRDIAKSLTTRYGDFFLAAERGYKKVAIFYSRDADVLSSRKPSSVRLICEGLWAACIHAGYPADFLTDRQVQNGKGMEYEVIIAPGWYYEKEMPLNTLAAMKRLAQAGKTIVVEKGSRIEVDGVSRLDSNLDDVDDKLGGTFPKYLDFDNERWWNMIAPTAEVIKDFLSAHVEPAAVHDLLVGPDWLRCRKGEYMVLANHAFTDFTGNHETLFQAPDMPTLRFPERPPVCYDMLEMKRVDVTTENGQMSITADMRHTPGKVYAFLPAAIESIVLRAPPRIEAGARLDYEIHVVDKTGTIIDAGIPVEILISNGDGYTLQHVYRAAAPRFLGVYGVPVNAVSSGLTIMARELISGKSIEVKIEIDEGTLAPVQLSDEPVLISDAAQVVDLLKGAQKTHNYRLTAADISNARQLVLRLRKGADELSRYLRDERFEATTREMVTTYRRKDEVKDELKQALVDELNRVIDGGRLFTQERIPPGILRIETGRLAETIEEGTKLLDLNRLLLEEYYSDAIQRKEPFYIIAEEPWLQEEAERLRVWLQEKDIRARVGSSQPWIREPMPSWGFEDNELVGLDGSRLWRGTVVQPGIYLDAPSIVLGRRKGLVTRAFHRDLLSDPVSENFPGRGRAIICWAPSVFALDYDATFILGTDVQGIHAGVSKLIEMDASDENLLARSRVAAPDAGSVESLPSTKSTEVHGVSFREMLSSEDRVTALSYSEVNDRVVAGTFGFGDNIFCFGSDGALLWKNFLPEHEVYLAEWIDNDRKILAATAHGWRIFLLDGETGKVLRTFSATEWPDLHVAEREFATRVKIVQNPRQRQIVIQGRSGIMAVDYEGNKMWFYDRLRAIIDYPTEAVQTGFAAFGKYIRMVGVWPSPDGSKIAYNESRYFASTYGFANAIVPLYRNEPRILDARTGKILLHNTSDPGASDDWDLSWDEKSSHLWIHARNLSAPLRNGPKGPDGVFQGELGGYIVPRRDVLKTGGVYDKDFHFVSRFDDAGALTWSIVDKTDFFDVKLDTLSDDHTRMYRSGREGWVLCLDMETGRKVWQSKMPYRSIISVSTNDVLTAGARNGTISQFDANGKVIWTKRLRDLHEVPARDYPNYLRAAAARDPDFTDEFFSISGEEAGDLDGVIRMGIEQLENGALNNEKGWAASTGTVTIAAPGHKDAKSLHLQSGQLVTSTIGRKIIKRGTYLLEFFYQSDESAARVTAGVVLKGYGDDHFTVSTYATDSKEWKFGRLAVKTYLDTEALEVGFEAGAHSVRIDSVSLRPIRFPSANLLADEELHKIEPTHTGDFRELYNRIPHEMREDLMSANHARAMMQSTPLGALVFRQEHAYLHNGRLDELDHMWTFRPNPIGFTTVLTQESWVSHVVLYLNNRAPELNYRAISILANDCNMEPNVPVTVGHVRGNTRRFLVVKLDRPILTDNVKVLPGHHRTWRDCLTEIELYGPVGGPDSLAHRGFAADPEAHSMFMGSATHVPATLPDDYVGTYKKGQNMGLWHAPAFNAGITIVNKLMSVATAVGQPHKIGESAPRALVEALPVTAESKKTFDQARAAETKEKRKRFIGWEAGTVTPLSTPARYSRRMIVGCADYKVHAVADNGVEIWEFSTGGRVYSSPTPDGDEVYFGSDDSRLYKVDIDSGILIWEFETGDRVRSAPALDKTTVYVASWDGHVYAIDKKRGGQKWKSPIGSLSSSSPALAGGRLYVGDEDGGMHALNIANGKKVWSKELAEPISTCPVVTPDGVLFVGDFGKAALLAVDGTVRWQRNVLDGMPAGAAPRITGQPFATKSQVVLTSNRGLRIIRRSDGVADTRFVPPRKDGNFVAAAPYGKLLCLTENKTHVQGDPGNWIVSNQGGGEVWEPKQ